MRNTDIFMKYKMLGIFKMLTWICIYSHTYLCRTHLDYNLLPISFSLFCLWIANKYSEAQIHEGCKNILLHHEETPLFLLAFVVYSYGKKKKDHIKVLGIPATSFLRAKFCPPWRYLYGQITYIFPVSFSARIGKISSGFNYMLG